MRSILLTAMMLAICFIFIFPFYLMIVMGTYKSEELFRVLAVVPSDYLLENIKTVFAKNFLGSYWNSFYIATLVTILSSLSCSMAGYAFAKYKFRGKKMLFNIVLIMLMIPAQLGLIAFIWEMKQFGWNDTHLPLILPALANSFGVFWMRQYIKDAVPDEVIDAARIDGCNEVRIFFQISLAFIRPALLSTGLLFFLWSWNDYMLPLLVINRTELQTIPLFIATLKDYIRTDYGAQIVGLSIGTLPILVIFSFFSKSLIKGLSSAAIKG
jgi:multiple sugar transport system permease protein/cellobiose transport system permease protein